MIGVVQRLRKISVTVVTQMAKAELIQVDRPGHSWQSRVVSLACRRRKSRNDRQIIRGLSRTNRAIRLKRDRQQLPRGSDMHPLSERHACSHSTLTKNCIPRFRNKKPAGRVRELSRVASATLQTMQLKRDGVRCRI